MIDEKDINTCTTDRLLAILQPTYLTKHSEKMDDGQITGIEEERYFATHIRINL